MTVLLATVAAIAALGSPASRPTFVEDFEHALRGWTKGDRHTLPLMLTDERAFSGRKCGYSGPPGKARVLRRDLPLPLVGRLEVRFYDDLAPAKHQIAAATGANKELLGIVCRGGGRYQVRVGRTYTPVPVKRSKGWHLFAWECNGRKTVAFIDGKEVHTNGRLGRIAVVSLGSFWDASTGWYDDLRAFVRPPSQAGPFVEAEEAFRQDGPPGAAIQVVAKPNASGMTINHWDKKGHAIEWAIGAPSDGSVTLLLKYATASSVAERTVEVDGNQTTLRVTNTGGWDRWEYVGRPLRVQAGINVVRMVNRTGSLNLDWLAFAPDGIDPQQYGPALDQWVRSDPWCRTAVAQTQNAARRAGVPPPEAPRPMEAMDSLPSVERLSQMVADAQHERQMAQARVLAAVKPKLNGIYRARPHKPLGQETPLSRECYQRLLRYVRLTQPKLADWPYAAGCRYHKWDHHNEYAVRQNATVALGYSVLLKGSYDAEVAGLPCEQIETDLKSLLRYIAITHKANFLPTGDGQPWGDQWQSALWARWAGHGAWLSWDLLDDDVKLMVARMIVHEANRFNKRRPDSGEWRDTKAEENAWNSMVIALAECMFPHHPNAELWRERAIVYMINSLTREADRSEARIVDGRPVKDRVTAVTIHPDFTLENHHRVHPDYLASGGLLMRSALVYHAADVPAPESLLYNVPETMQVVKRFTAINGSYFYVNGQDWWPHRHDSPLTVSGFKSVLTNDRDAAFLERSTLEFLGRMHARFDDGRAWHPREYNYRNAEEEMIARYSELYLLHRLLGDGSEPVKRDEFLRHQSGTHVYDIGGFVTHRTPEKFCSFAWVNGAMGLVYPSDDTWFASPSERGMVGRITCEGLRDTTPKIEQHRVQKLASGFAFVGRIARCDGKVEQNIGVFSLASGPVIYLERLVAREDVNVKEVATGLAAILNEDAPGISPNYRMLHRAEGRLKIVGAGRERPRVLRFASSWANVDGKLGMVATSHSMAYRNNNAYRRSRLEEELIANYRTDIGRVAKGQELAACAVVFVPNQPPGETEKARVDMARPGRGIVAARFGDSVVAANLGRAPAGGNVWGRPVHLEPLATAVLSDR